MREWEEKRMKKIDDYIKHLADGLLEKVYQFEDADAEYDEGYLYNASSHTCFEEGNLHINYWFSYDGNNDYMELEVFNLKNEHFYDRIADAVEAKILEEVKLCEIRNAFDDAWREAAMEDEWTRNGFRDAADYYHWRYG